VADWKAHHFFYHGDLDVALKHFVRPAVAELAARGLIESFFFIRYTLGGPHLRLRYRLPALAADASEAAAGEVLHAAAARFLERWRSVSTLDPERIRQESRAILDAVQEESELYYEDNSLLPFAFKPEVERYGGPELLEASLDFFAVSSAQALEAVCDPGWEFPGRRGALAFRLLFRQARGFAESEEELLSHLGYRLPVRQEVGDEIWSKADRDFEARRETYRTLLKHELSLLAKGDAPILYEAAQRLSRAVSGQAPRTRWQIGHSQLHMTANRLGFFPVQEMHLQRILWRAARDLAEAEPATYKFLTAEVTP
jgi:thiopeptide-type bacteriocin biosynthesis protein